MSFYPGEWFTYTRKDVESGANFSYLERRDGYLFLEGFMFDMILIVLFDSDYRVMRIQDG